MSANKTSTQLVIKVVGTLALLAAPLAARAEQKVLFDITYTHTGANDAHHGIPASGINQPDNWTAPIDYTQGTMHFYQEVMTKPSNKETIIDFCLMSTRDYGCIETRIYTTTGVHETMRSMAGGDVDKRSLINFTQKMRSIQMVLKTPAPTFINGGRPQSDFLPSKMRFVATLVSPGGMYIRPVPTPGFEIDGGAGSPSDAAVSNPTSDAAAADSKPTTSTDAAPAAPDVPMMTDPGTPPPSTTPPPSQPTTTADAGSGSKPTTTPTTPKPPATPDPAPVTSSAPSCSMAQGAGGGAGLMLLAGLAMALRTARRTRRRG